MVVIQPEIIIWLIAWAILGSTLGFFTIRYKSRWTKKQKRLEYIKSIVVGVFFALPICVALIEFKVTSITLSILLGGSSAFAITDLIIGYWNKICNGIGMAISKLIDKLIEKI